MTALICDHGEDIDGAGVLLSYTDASSDFGPGAVVVSCPCGGWIVEDADGRMLAQSAPAIIAEVEHRRAA